MNTLTVGDRTLTPRLAATDLFRLSLPLIAVSLSRMLMGFIDFLMISYLGEPGSQLSTDAQAAVSPATLVLWAFMCLGVGTVTSVQTFASQADGRGEPAVGAAYAWQGAWAGLASLIVLWPISMACDPFYAIVGALGGHAASVVEMEIAYSQVAVWSLTPAVIATSLESFFNGVQRPRITFLAVLAALAANALGNWLLIWGNLGFPEMGIAGAALATVIGWWVRAAVLAIAFLSRGTHARFQTRSSARLNLAKCWDIFAIGGATGAAWLADISAWLMFTNFVLPLFGTAAMAANGIALQYTHLAFMPAIGIGMALCSQVGFAIGAGRMDEVHLRVRVALWVTMTYMGAVGLLLFALRVPLLGILTQDPAVLAVGMGIMCWVAVYQVFDAMSITFIFALRGAGDTRIPALLNGLCCWVIFIGVGYTLALTRPELGIHGPWSMAAAYLSVLGFLLLWRYNGGAWRNMSIFGERTVPDEKPADLAIPVAGSV